MLPTCTAWGPCNLILHNVIALLSSLSLKYWAKLLRNFLQLWLITAAAAVRSSTSQFARRAWADNPPHFWSALFVWLYLYSIRFLLFEEYNFYLEAIRFVLAWTGNLPQLWSTFFFVSIQSEDFVWGLGFCMGVGILYGGWDLYFEVSAWASNAQALVGFICVISFVRGTWFVLAWAGNWAQLWLTYWSLQPSQSLGGLFEPPTFPWVLSCKLPYPILVVKI